MLLLVQIDLSHADVARFEAYEAAVLALLPGHGGRLEARLRSTDGRSEFHVVAFPDAAAAAAFRTDPRRAALQGLWAESGATSVVTEVARIG